MKIFGFTLAAVIAVGRAQGKENAQDDFIGTVPLSEVEENEISRLVGGALRGAGGSRDEKKLRRQQVKKTKHLLRLTKFAIPERRSRDWIGYGCYCFPQPKGDFLSLGIGAPFDGLDRACKALAGCLKCGEIDHEKSRKCHSYAGYSFDNFLDEVTGQKGIKCTDSDPCRRSVCDCDAQFIQALQENDFDHDLSKNQGFERLARCPKSARVGEMDAQKSGGKSIGMMGRTSQEDEGEPQCCGKPGQRRQISASQTRQCCKHVTYNPFILNCCADGRLVTHGTEC